MSSRQAAVGVIARLKVLASARMRASMWIGTASRDY
jgi:hypothetical protein